MRVYGAGDLCVVCMDAAPKSVLIPCGHLCTCSDCTAVITALELDCPICRSRIGSVADHTTEQDRIASLGDPDRDRDVIPIPEAELAEFRESRRQVRSPRRHTSQRHVLPALGIAPIAQTYLAHVRRPLTGNAGFAGKTVLSRTVGAYTGSALEQRRAETAGTERLGSSPVFTVELGQLEVVYKAGRRTVRETYDYHADCERLLHQLGELLEGERITMLEVAAHYADFYFCMRYHLGDRLEAVLIDHDIVASKRRRR